MKKLAGFITMLLGALFMAACSSSSPSDVAKKAYGYIQDENYEDFVDLLYIAPGEDAEKAQQDKESLVLLMAGLSKQNSEKKDKVKSYEVISEEIDENGEKAVVTMKVVYEDGKEKEETTNLQKDEDGNWKIKLSK